MQDLESAETNAGGCYSIVEKVVVHVTNPAVKTKIGGVDFGKVWVIVKTHFILPGFPIIAQIVVVPVRQQETR